MKKILLVLPFLMLAFLWACDDDAEIVRMENPDPNATITSVSPQRGLVGTVVTIAGTNFGAASQLVQVYFTGVEESVPLLSCEDKELQVAVPEGAQTGPLTIVVMNQKIVTDLEFAVTPDPEITSISMQQGYAGDEVVITGKNFGTVMEDVKLYSTIDEEEVTFEVISCTDTEIKAKVPAVSAFGQYELYLSILGRSAVNSLMFNFLEQASISSVEVENPLIGEFVFAGDNVIVKGTGFGTVADEVEVTMGGLVATVVSCTNEEIKAQVPDGFAGGAVTVTRNNRQAVSEKELQILAPNTDISSFVLKNYKQPFTAKAYSEGQAGDNTGDVWAEPTDWIVNDAVKNMYNRDGSSWASVPTGGLSTSKNLLTIQVGWNKDVTLVSNGKIYQNIKLPKGKYKVQIAVEEVANPARGTRYFVICEGEELPNQESLETNNISYLALDAKQNYEHIFTLNQVYDNLSLGFLANITQSESNLKVSSVKLIYLGSNN